MNVRFRSRDAYDAAFMNMYAFIRMQERMAKQISEKAGREVKVGRYCDLSDSFHIYGKRIEDFKTRVADAISVKSTEDRTWTREEFESFSEGARERVLEKVKQHDAETATT
jgi:thymidylate synthase